MSEAPRHNRSKRPVNAVAGRHGSLNNNGVFGIDTLDQGRRNFGGTSETQWNLEVVFARNVRI